MNPLPAGHSPRNEHSRTEFGKKNSDNMISLSLSFFFLFFLPSSSFTGTIRIFEENLKKIFHRKSESVLTLDDRECS